jgi:hypothetical protein
MLPGKSIMRVHTGRGGERKERGETNRQERHRKNTEDK